MRAVILGFALALYFSAASAEERAPALFQPPKPILAEDLGYVDIIVPQGKNHNPDQRQWLVAKWLAQNPKVAVLAINPYQYGGWASGTTWGAQIFYVACPAAQKYFPDACK